MFRPLNLTEPIFTRVFSVMIKRTWPNEIARFQTNFRPRVFSIGLMNVWPKIGNNRNRQYENWK